MINPFICYSFAFSISILVYLLGWSELYPDLTFSLVTFLIITIIGFGYWGKRMTKDKFIVFTNWSETKMKPLWITFFIYLLWAADFFYEGGIPLFKILLDQPYNYRLFGVPSLHVFTVTFCSFYTVYLFQNFLATKSRKIFGFYLINLMAAVLIYSRAMLFFNLTSCLFLYLIFLKRIPLRMFIMVIAGTVVLFFLFGVLGNLRVTREAKEKYNNTNFLNTGKATDNFRRSPIPKEYFWSYIYISSPLANLQENVNNFPVSLSVDGVLKMLNSEIIPDFISKRVSKVLEWNEVTDRRIVGPFNVSTVYSRSYSYAGWPGMLMIALTLAIIPFIYLKILPPTSHFSATGWAILCTIFFFSSYDNMLRFTGLSLQPAYAILLYWLLEKGKLKIIFGR